MLSGEVYEALYAQEPHHPLVAEMEFILGILAGQEQVTRHMRLRKAEVARKIAEELARSAGSAARETPGASTEQRT